MTATLQLSENPLGQLRSTPLAPYAGIYEGYLGDHGYAPSTQGGYLRCLVHFGRWMSQCGLNAEDLDEEGVAQFLDEHLPHCRCPAPVVHRREDLRAALGHLLVVLRANAVIPERVLTATPWTRNCVVSMSTWSMCRDSQRKRVESIAVRFTACFWSNSARDPSIFRRSHQAMCVGSSPIRARITVPRAELSR